MDDPWGSPWTSAAPAERTPSPTKSAKSDLEPPPRAFLSNSNSPRLPAVSIQSPWADDNEGFGDWAAADPPTTIGHSASAWGGGWGGGSDTASINGHHLTPTPKDEGFGFAQASPIAWPGSIASPSAKNGSGSAFRQPSPDPWASEFDDLKNAGDTPRFVLDSPPVPTRTGKELESEVENENQAPVWNDTDGGHRLNGSAEGSTDVIDEDTDHDVTAVDNTMDNVEEEGHDQSRPSTSSKPRSSHSRSSSASRHDSESDMDRQDSPITSIDEDAKSRITLPPRKVSGKIQVLVERFDGLAKAASEESLAVQRGSEVTPQKARVQDAESPLEDIADFSDFENAEAATPAGPNPESSPTSSRLSLVRTRTPRSRSPETPTRQRSPLDTKTTRGHSTSESSNVQSPAKRRVSVIFDVDVQKVHNLFDDLQLDPPASQSDIASALPDHIIDDSFTQISERKAWYRISRQGSSRMHNSGDDDSYRRVAWPTTTTHHDTLKIVRHWMEQDSITGRTTLGGGSNKTSMFNWDSSAEPVALHQVFARRRAQTHQRPVSLQQPLKPPLAMSAAITLSTEKPSDASKNSKQRPMSLADPPAAAFGWSTTPVEPPVERLQPAIPDRPESDQWQAQTAPQVPPGVIFPPSLPVARQEDDEDEWGEMMSSPVKANFSRPGVDIIDVPTTGTTSFASSSNEPPAVPTGLQRAEVPGNIIPDSLTHPQHTVPQKQLSSDPWATSDQLSIFDTPAEPNVKAKITDTGFPPTSPLAILSPLTVSNMTPIEQTSTTPSPTVDSTEADSLVRQIVDNLPDLSYMLR